jgi:hypothetical protein
MFHLFGNPAKGSDIADIGFYCASVSAVTLNLGNRLASSASVAGRASAVGLTGPANSRAMTSAPFAANSTAIARPIPRAAPVTTAIFPASVDPRSGRIAPAVLSAGGTG